MAPAHLENGEDENQNLNVDEGRQGSDAFGEKPSQKAPHCEHGGKQEPRRVERDDGLRKAQIGGIRERRRD